MNKESQKSVMVAFLRGINVGGHHKVPMAELKTTLVGMGFSNIKTLLNSGNVVFTAPARKIEVLEKQIAEVLEKQFGFPIPVLIRKMEDIQGLVARNPFKDIGVHKDIRLYVTFLKAAPKNSPNLPWVSPDGSYRILSLEDEILLSVLNVAKSKTTDAMVVLEKNYTKNITTRNWNTLLKLEGMG